jgi:hypothetical protein
MNGHDLDWLTEPPIMATARKNMASGGNYTDMTLRDYFAAQALTNEMLMGDVWLLAEKEQKGNPARVVHRAYEIADLMIAERSKG